MAEKRITWDLLSSLITQLWAKIKANFTNKIEIIKVNGAIQTIGTSKDVNITIPAAPTKLSQLTNDLGFITEAVTDLTNYYTKSTTYTKTEVDARISAIPKFAIAVVTALPTAGISKTTIYLKKASGTTQTDNVYEEFIYINDGTADKWEKLGELKVDLTGYLTLAAADKKYLTLEGAKAIYAAINGNETQPFNCNFLGLGSKNSLSVSSSGFVFKAGTNTITLPLTTTNKVVAYKSDIPVLDPFATSDDVTTLINSLT